MFFSGFTGWWHIYCLVFLLCWLQQQLILVVVQFWEVYTPATPAEVVVQDQVPSLPIRHATPHPKKPFSLFAQHSPHFFFLLFQECGGKKAVKNRCVGINWLLFHMYNVDHQMLIFCLRHSYSYHLEKASKHVSWVHEKVSCRCFTKVKTAELTWAQRGC